MKRRWIIHPLCVGWFPILHLYSQNLGYSSLREVVLPLLAVTAGSILLLCLLALCLRDRRKAALLCTAAILLFFSFGPVHDAVYSTKLLGASLGRARILGIAYVLLYAIGALLLIRWKRPLDGATSFANRMVCVLILLPVGSAAIRIASGGVVMPFSESKIAALLDQGCPLGGLKAPESPRDIYYILLDGYARHDTLQRVYKLDNSGFLDNLRKQGFVVAGESLTNYSKTAQVLASSLNMQYLDKVSAALGEDFQSMMPLCRMIHENKVASALRDLGYKFVCFSSGWEPTEIREADVLLASPWSLSEFQIGLLNMTPVRIVLDKLGFWSTREMHRRRIQYALEKLKTLPEDPSPKFVFAHLMCPHPPFVFEADGSPFEEGGPFNIMLWDAGDFSPEDAAKRQEWMARGYPQQVAYVSREIEEVVRQLLHRSRIPPIIVIQGDHGTDASCRPPEIGMECLRERFPILNVLHLPGIRPEQLHSRISPVNVFRVILSEYFGAGLDILPDESYWTDYRLPFRFLCVTAELRPAEAPR
jgi:hypothetical protein